MMKKTIPLLLAVLTLQGCMRYWHDVPFLDANPELLSNKTITVYSEKRHKSDPETFYFEIALKKKGFHIIPYSDVKKIAPDEFEKYEPTGRFTLLIMRTWFSPKLIETLKNEYALDAILYENSYFYKYLGLWSGHCGFTVIELSTGNILATGWMDVDGAFSPQGALDKTARQVVDMMIYSAKTGKRWDLIWH